MDRASIKQHASGWRRIDSDDARTQSEDVQQALQLSHLLRQLVSRVDSGTGQSLVRLSENATQALHRRDAKERELLDGLKLASIERERLQVELEHMSHSCEDFDQVQSERDEYKSRAELLEQELCGLKEECHTLRRRLSSMQQAFKEVRQHRDQLLDELAGVHAEKASQIEPRSPHERALSSQCSGYQEEANAAGAMVLASGHDRAAETASRAIVLVPSPGQTLEHTDFLFTESGQDDDIDAEEEISNLPICLQKIAVRFVWPAASAVQHVAMMLVFHHGYLHSAAAHAASTFMHHTASATVASTTGHSVAHSVGHSLIHGSHTLMDDGEEKEKQTGQQASLTAEDDADVANAEAPEALCSAGVKVGGASLHQQLARADITACHTVQARDLQHSAGRPISSKQGCQTKRPGRLMAIKDR